MFRFQFKALHIPLAGMHGSFVLTPARIEKEITWDMGPQGSILEDSYFALVAGERGIQFDWVEGFIKEQSPHTLPDLIRQRRRWFCGLASLSSNPIIRLRNRIGLRIMVTFWAIAALTMPLPLVYIQQRFMFGNGVLPYWIFVTFAASTGFYLRHSKTFESRRCSINIAGINQIRHKIS